MITLLVVCIGLFLGTGAILGATIIQWKQDDKFIVHLTSVCIFFIIFWLSLGGIIQTIVYLITGRFI
ncbi:hypothetical protein SHANETTE_85 [Bacillus phage Shanette]|uniref:Uncharacterized protein n=2 Tax=Siminovitchvirus TaxID=1918721 RepID=S5MM56_9CAUD|nr:hypothetical protein AVV47_gp212 [Bacillus phage JL]YP_009216080.1 hypothetical protein AVV46_gp212 [Bacillus phage Shanette]AGR46760.1 hypothetical protein JL_84 [Bacillus phage JL]AGR46979.1 hypothetical protein SHANETTE_85 [Bacillus phage Shanette]